MRTRLKVLGVVCALGAAAVGCGSGDDDAGAEDPETESSGPYDEVCTDERVGGRVTVAAASLGVSLDPYTSSGGAAASVLETLPIYDSLLRYDSANDEFVGQLAESIESNDDASEWTLRLRDGVEFGNGDPFDAEAVKASVERHIAPESESRLGAAGALIEGIEVVDPLTVRFVLTEPWGYFPLHLSAGGGSTGALGMIQNVAVVDEIGADAFGQDPQGGGAGPYEVKEWSPPERVVLEAKDDWWGGTVCIEELEFIDLADGTDRLDAMETGELDVAVLNRDPVVGEEAAELFPSVQTINLAGTQLEINHAHPELGDPRVRQAIALAIDPTVVDDRATGGAGIPWSGLVTPGADLLEPTDGIEFDPDAARDLVEELKSEGMELSFELIYGPHPAIVESGLALEALLEAVGFEISTSTVETNPLQVRVYRERDFELVIGGQLALGEASLYPSLYRFDGENPANPYGLASPELDGALETLKKAGSTQELQDAMDALQEVWNEVIPAVVIGSESHGTYWNERVHGLYFTRGVTPYFDKAFVDQ